MLFENSFQMYFFICVYIVNSFYLFQLITRMTRLNAKKRYPDLETTNGECALFFRIYKMVHTVISLSVPAGEISTKQGCE